MRVRCGPVLKVWDLGAKVNFHFGHNTQPALSVNEQSRNREIGQDAIRDCMKTKGVTNK